MDSSTRKDVAPRGLRRRVAHASTGAPATPGLFALGALWLIDGVLKLQPYFFHHLAAGVIGVSAEGQPSLIAAPIKFVESIVSRQQPLFAVASAIVEISIGVALLTRRFVKPALLLSCVWALNVWLTGEGLGGLFTSATPRPMLGVLGTSPLYVLAAILVWPREHTAKSSTPSIGLLTGSGARVVWAVLWLAAAALWLFPANSAAKASSAAFLAAPAGASWLASMHSAVAHASAGSGMTIALIAALVSAEIALSVLWGRGTRIALIASIALSLSYWLLAEGFGGLLTGEATDVGTAPIMVLIAVLLLPLGSGVARTSTHIDLASQRGDGRELAPVGS